MSESTLPTPGDILVVHSKGFLASMIRLGERLRSPLTDAYWNHVAIMVEPGADGLPRIVQADASGVVYSPLHSIGSDYIALPLSSFAAIGPEPVDPVSVVEQAHAIVGAKYGWLTIFSIVCNILTPQWIRFPAFRRGQTFICSAAGAWCLHAGGADIDTYDIYQVLPSEVREMANWST